MVVVSLPSGRCKVPYLPGVWAVMVSNWSRVRGHAPILRPHRVRHRSEPVRRRPARRFLDSLSRRAASIPDSRPVRWSSPSALTAGCGTSAASKSPQSSANSRIQFWDNTRSGGERADVGGHKELQLNYEYKEHPGVTHGPIIAASMPDIYAFFAKHSKH